MPAATPFLNACRDGNQAEVVRLLRREPGLVHRRDPRGGWTGLMLAAKFEWPSIVKLLLAAGADPCAANQFQATALHWAAVSGNLETVDTLLDAAAAAAAPTTPAAPTTLLLNARDCFGTTALIAGARHGRVAVVQRLLRARGVEVDATDKDGMSATWRVACWGKAEVLRVLLMEGGADFALPDKTGRRPIDVARDLDRHACVALLLEAERGYALWKARWLREEALLRSLGPGSVSGGEAAGEKGGGRGLPGWCGEGRVGLPVVELGVAAASGEEEQGEEEEERREAWAKCVAVTHAVVEELPLDLFNELSLHFF